MAKVKGKDVSKLIRESAEALEVVMQTHLFEVAEGMIEQVRRNLKSATPSQIVNAIKGVAPTGSRAYESDLVETLATISIEAIAQAKKQVPKAKSKQFVESENTIKLGDFDKLSNDLKKQIKLKASLLVGTQFSDLEKNIFFQFDSSHSSTDSINEIIDDLYEASDDYIKGVAIQAGSGTIAARMINEARNAFFFEDDVLDEIGAFEFYNGDPVSEICTELAGQVIPKDDPALFRYTPPLHFNCKSTLLPLDADDPKVNNVEKLNPTKSAKDSVQFHECRSCSRPS